jgi:hypothetical protein
MNVVFLELPSTLVFGIRGIEFMIHTIYFESNLHWQDSGRHNLKMINVEGYSAIGDGFVADEDPHRELTELLGAESLAADTQYISW